MEQPAAVGRSSSSEEGPVAAAGWEWDFSEASFAAAVALDDSGG